MRAAVYFGRHHLRVTDVDLGSIGDNQVRVNVREFISLLKIEDNFPKYVVTLDEFNMSRDGIKHMNIREFLRMKTLS